MGVLIACEEIKAKFPYRFKITGTVVYTVEELCYYIYHNILLLTDELLEDSFLQWLEKELHLTEKAGKLREVKETLEGYEALSEAAFTLLTGGNYYSTEEIQGFLNRQKERKNITPAKAAVNKADSFLKYGQYSEAAMIYEILLNSASIQGNLREETGKIRHNLGICRLHQEGFHRAAADFKAAYDLTGNEESKKQYVLSLLLSLKVQEQTAGEDATERQPSAAELETLCDSIEPEYIEAIMNEIKNSLSRYQETESYNKLLELKARKNDSKPVNFGEEANKLITVYKEEYRSENA